jgi:hypothetical protein
MDNIIRILIFPVIVLLFCGCKSSKGIYYSYKVGTYSIGTEKSFLYSDDLITYEDYLFEFEKLVRNRREIHGNSDTTYTSYDTTGVYLLSGIDSLYFLFDTFALKNQIVGIGGIKDKPSGIKFKSAETKSSPDVIFTTPKKVLVNNIRCFVARIVSKQPAQDSIEQKIFLIKNKHFNSLYKIYGIQYPENKYCIIGIQITNLMNNVSFLQQIESMKPLSEKQKEICAGMIRKAKLSVLDSVRKN